MVEAIEHVSVVLGEKMPALTQDLRKRTSNVRRLRMHDGPPVELTYMPGDVPFGDGSVVMLMNIGKAEDVASALAVAARESARHDVNVLAFAKSAVFNQPRLQNVIQSLGRATRRLGVIVEDKPQNLTLSKVEARLKEWIPIWHSSAENEETQEQHYLAFRKRLSDEKTGRLDGQKIASLLGLNTPEMGSLCGVSRQSFHANPTSKGIQPKLEVLAEVARGVLWCGNDEARFRAWLTRPNPDFPEYEGRQLSPLDLIRMGHAGVIASKVQNLLTGHPS